jgi:GH18 family chitinase
MKTIVIQHKSAIEIINIVHEMKRYGWTDGVDFDWAYHRSSTHDTRDRRAVFNFYKEEYSTYFALRWV